MHNFIKLEVQQLMIYRGNSMRKKEKKLHDDAENNTAFASAGSNDKSEWKTRKVHV